MRTNNTGSVKDKSFSSTKMTEPTNSSGTETVQTGVKSKPSSDTGYSSTFPPTNSTNTSQSSTIDNETTPSTTKTESRSSKSGVGSEDEPRSNKSGMKNEDEARILKSGIGSEYEARSCINGVTDADIRASVRGLLACLPERSGGYALCAGGRSGLVCRSHQDPAVTAPEGGRPVVIRDGCPTHEAYVHSRWGL